MEKIWFISDTHFGHKNIQKFCPKTRLGKDIAQHDEILIRNWQEQVSHQDRVYHLGDFFFCNGDRALSILERLPGQIHFIRGNHDKVLENSILRSRFTSVSDYKEIEIENQKVVLFHFPIYEWNRMHHGSFHLFGHVHNSVDNKQVPGRAMDVGVDTRNPADMKLWSWQEIKNILSKREVRGHHGNKMADM